MEHISKQEFKKLTDSVKRIETALLGDPQMKIVGVVDKIEKHEDYIDKAKKRHAWVIGASGGAGFSLSLAWEYFKHKLGL
jgi:hypothetical protein